MPIVIKEMHVRTVVERRIVTEAELPEEILRKIENQVVERLSARESGQPDTTTDKTKKRKVTWERCPLQLIRTGTSAARASRRWICPSIRRR